MGLVLIYDSFSDSAIFSGGAWDAALPLTNLRTDDVGLVAQSTSLDPADTQFTVDLGKARPIGGMVIGPCNCGAGATAVVTAYSDAAMTMQVYTSGALAGTADSVDWANTGDWLAWEDPDFWLGIKSTDPEVEALPFYFYHVVPAASASSALARYWKVEIDDPSNPNGLLRVGRVILGRAYRPAYNYSYGANETGITWVTDTRESLMGRRTYWARYMRRRVRFGWEYLPEAEAFGDWFRLSARAGLHRQIFIVPEEADTGSLRRKRAFLATLTEAPAISQVIFENASMALQADEVI